MLYKHTVKTGVFVTLYQHIQLRSGDLTVKCPYRDECAWLTSKNMTLYHYHIFIAIDPIHHLPNGSMILRIDLGGALLLGS